MISHNILLFLIKTFSIMFVGFIIFRYFISKKYLSVLSKLFVEFLIPALILNKFILHFNMTLLKDYWYIPLFTLFVLFLSYIMSLFLRKAMKIKFLSEFTAMLTFTNAGYLVLPIILEIFRDTSKNDAIIFNFMYTLLVSFLLWSLGVYLITGKNKKIDIRSLPTPFIITILAIILAVINTKKIIPPFVFKSLNILGLIGVYGIMLVLGGILSQIPFNKTKVYGKETLRFVIIKNFLYPLIFLGILHFIHLNSVLKAVLFMVTITPPATNLAIISERYPINKRGHDYIYSSIFWSYVTSIISIPIFLIIYFMVPL
ncbi:AEC family transporter [bacterium]|nr:AEC family transporter [bacterium]